MATRIVSFVLFALSQILLSSVALAASIDFESLMDGQSVGSEYAGVTFLGTTAWKAGVNLNEFEFPPVSGITVAAPDGDVIEIYFASAIGQFQGYLTHSGPIQLSAFDQGNHQIASITSTFSNNLGFSGDLGSTPNELLSVSSSTGVWSIKIAGVEQGTVFTIDDLSYQALSPIPEPSIGVLLFFGLCALGLSKRRAGQRYTG